MRQTSAEAAPIAKTPKGAEPVGVEPDSTPEPVTVEIVSEEIVSDETVGDEVGVGGLFGRGVAGDFGQSFGQLVLRGQFAFLDQLEEFIDRYFGHDDASDRRHSTGTSLPTTSESDYKRTANLSELRTNEGLRDGSRPSYPAP